MAEVTTYANDIAAAQNASALEAIRKTGKTQVITLTADEKKAWKKALLPVHREMEPKIGKELITSIYKETGFDPGKL